MPSPFSWVLAVVALLWLSLPLPTVALLVLAVWPVWLLLSASEPARCHPAYVLRAESGNSLHTSHAFPLHGKPGSPHSGAVLLVGAFTLRCSQRLCLAYRTAMTSFAPHVGLNSCSSWSSHHSEIQHCPLFAPLGAMWYYFSFINKVTVGSAHELNACLFSFLSKAGSVAADLQ